MAFVRVPGNDVPTGAEEHWFEGRGGVKVRIMTAPPTRGPPLVPVKPRDDKKPKP